MQPADCLSDVGTEGFAEDGGSGAGDEARTTYEAARGEATLYMTSKHLEGAFVDGTGSGPDYRYSYRAWELREGSQQVFSMGLDYENWTDEINSTTPLTIDGRLLLRRAIGVRETWTTITELDPHTLLPSRSAAIPELGAEFLGLAGMKIVYLHDGAAWSLEMQPASAEMDDEPAPSDPVKSAELPRSLEGDEERECWYLWASYPTVVFDCFDLAKEESRYHLWDAESGSTSTVEPLVGWDAIEILGVHSGRLLILAGKAGDEQAGGDGPATIWALEEGEQPERLITVDRSGVGEFSRSLIEADLDMSTLAVLHSEPWEVSLYDLRKSPATVRSIPIDPPQGGWSALEVLEN